MADITDSTALGFVAAARELADQLEESYWLAKRIDRDWNARELSKTISNKATDAVKDGHKRPVAGSDVTALVTRAQEFVADYEASSGAKLNTLMKMLTRD